MTRLDEKNGMDNLKIMDNGKGLEPAQEATVMICCDGGATDFFVH